MIVQHDRITVTTGRRVYIKLCFKVIDRIQIKFCSLHEAKRYIDKPAVVLRGNTNSAPVLRPGDRTDGTLYSESFRLSTTQFVRGILPTSAVELYPNFTDLKLAGNNITI